MKKEEMQKINIDGKIYYLEEDVEKYIISEIQDNKCTKTFLENSVWMIDEYNIIGMGSCDVNESFVAVNISIKYLENAIKSIKTFDSKKENITLVWSKEFPLMIGNVNKNKFAGIIIAPTRDSE